MIYVNKIAEGVSKEAYGTIGFVAVIVKILAVIAIGKR
jgi:hypothetical protein